MNLRDLGSAIFAACRRPVIVVLFLLAGSATACADPSPASLSSVALTPDSQTVALAEHAQIVCDQHGTLSFEAAQSASYLPLQGRTSTTADCSGYWIRFSLHREASAVGNWILQSEHPWRHADLYFVHNGVPVRLQTGIDVPPQDRAIPSGLTALPLPLNEGQTQEFYLHLTGDTTRYGESRSLAADVIPLTRWLLQQRSLLFWQGIYAGIIVGLALYNLILFLTIRERVYLYYVLYVVAFATIWIARSGFFYQYLWPHHFLFNQQYLAYVAAAAIIFSVLFVRAFLTTRAYFPPIDRILLVALFGALLTCVAGAFAGPAVMSFPLATLGLVVSFLYAGIGYFALVRGYRPARFFLVAWGALLVGNVLYILMFLRLLPTTLFTYNAAQVGSAFECILLAFALADRVDLRNRAEEERQVEYTRALQEQIRQRTGELSEAVERLKTASVTDPLTGLSNRRHVEAAVQPWIADLRRARIRNTPGVPRRSLAICLADLDHFKQINDELGHVAGDRVLQASADTLRQNVRATALLARWGGEEFLVLDHVTGAYEDIRMAERLRVAIVHEDSAVFAHLGRPMSLSIGVVRYPFTESHPDLLDWDHCLALADHALYRAKRAGRNRWICYRPREAALRAIIHERGVDEVKRLLRLNTDEALSLGLIELVDHVESEVEVG